MQEEEENKTRREITELRKGNKRYYEEGDNKPKDRHFVKFFIPDNVEQEIQRISKLSQTAITILIHFMLSVPWEENIYTLDKDNLAKVLNKSTSTLKRALAELKKAEYIENTKDGFCKVNSNIFFNGARDEKEMINANNTFPTYNTFVFNIGNKVVNMNIGTGFGITKDTKG